MRKSIQALVISCAIVASVAESTAQNRVVNVIQDLQFKLTGYYQMNDTENSKTLFRNAGKISIRNKDIINLIEEEVGIIFSSNARLLLISTTPVDLRPRVVIRDRFQGDLFETDVTQYFSAEVRASVEDVNITKNPFKAKGASYDVIVFGLNVSQVQFQVMGYGKTRVSTGKLEGDPVAVVHTGKVEASGAGEFQVTPLSGVVPVALTGKVEISGANVKAKVE